MDELAHKLVSSDGVHRARVFILDVFVGDEPLQSIRFRVDFKCRTLLEFVERLVRAATLRDLYFPLGFELVKGLTDFALIVLEKPVPVGGGVQNSVGDGTEDLEDLFLYFLH